MSTLGQKPAAQHVSTEKQTITGNGGTSYTLQQSVSQASDIEVFVNNTRQEPTVAYTANNTTLTMTGAVNSSDSFYVIFQGKAIQTAGLPVDAAITASTVTTSQTITSTGNITTSGTVNTPSINGGQIGGRRNLVINGAMQVAQRGTSQASISSAGYYTIDRFKINTNDAGVWTMSQEALSSSDTPFTKGFSKALKLDCTTSATPASNGTLQVQYSSEGQDLQQLISGTSSAKTLILSFWIKATKTGTNVFGGYQDDGGKSFGLTYTINSSNTWEYKTITIPANTADVIANDATRGRIVTWYFSAGTNRTTGTLRSTWTTYATADEAPGQVNHADNTANNIHITGVQLEVGSQATPFEHRSFGEELNLCRRYFKRIEVGNNTRISTSAYADTTSRARFVIYHNIQMRSTPTVAETNLDLGGTDTDAIATVGSPDLNDVIITRSAGSHSTGAILDVHQGSNTATLDFASEL